MSCVLLDEVANMSLITRGNSLITRSLNAVFLAMLSISESQSSSFARQVFCNWRSPSHCIYRFQQDAALLDNVETHSFNDVHTSSVVQYIDAAILSGSVAAAAEATAAVVADHRQFECACWGIL